MYRIGIKKHTNANRKKTNDKQNNCPFIVYFIVKKNWQLLNGGITGKGKLKRKYNIMMLGYIFFFYFMLNVG